VWPALGLFVIERVRRSATRLKDAIAGDFRDLPRQQNFSHARRLVHEVSWFRSSIPLVTSALRDAIEQAS
jgi:hypothetical protein